MPRSTWLLLLTAITGTKQLSSVINAQATWLGAILGVKGNELIIPYPGIPPAYSGEGVGIIWGGLGGWGCSTRVLNAITGVAPWGWRGKPCGGLVQRAWVIIKRMMMVEDNILVRDLRLAPWESYEWNKTGVWRGM